MMKTGRLRFIGSLWLLSFLGTPQNNMAQTSVGPRLEFAYAVDQNANAVFGYKVAATGALTPLPTQSIRTGGAPNSLAVDPSGHFLYVANLLTDNVSGYAIGANGSLTPVPGSPFAAGSGPGWITVDPTGRFAYVANCARLCSGNGDGNVSGYVINRTTGSLSPAPGSPFPADKVPYAVVTDAMGRYAYVANFASGTVSVFAIDQCGGFLTLDQTIATGGTDPWALTFDSLGRFLYVTNTTSDNVTAFAVGQYGSLSVVPGSPFTSGNFTQGIAVSPSGEFLYLTAGNNLLAYRIGPGGQLTPLTGSPFAASGFLVSLALDKTGQFLYGATADGVDAFRMDATTGHPAIVAGSPFAAGGNAVFVTPAIGHN